MHINFDSSARLFVFSLNIYSFFLSLCIIKLIATIRNTTFFKFLFQVKYFDRRRDYLKYTEKLESGYDPVEESQQKAKI